MGVSIIAIIIIQIVWIKNAIYVKNELIEKSIIDALSESAQDIEAIRSKRMFSSFTDDTDSVSWNDFNSPQYNDPYNFSDNQNRFDSSPKDTTRTASRKSNRNRFNNSPLLENQDSIIASARMMFRSSMTRIDSLSKVADSLRIMTPQIKEQFDFQKEKLEEVTNQIVSEINSFNNNLVTIDEMYNIVKYELKEKRIPLNFDLALMKNDTIISLTANADSLALAHPKYQRHLFSRNIFERNQSIAIHIPKQTDLVLRSVYGLLIASVIFSLIILLTFGLSIYFMLKQKKISEMKSDFINNMTHEFKTPLATISVAADTIINSKVITQPERISYFIEMIKKENKRMNRQVEDILAIARLDKKDFEFKWEPLNIHDTIDDVIESIIIQVEDRGGSLNTSLKASNPMITSDMNHCANIIYNLLDNANKYSTEKPQINIETQNISDGIIISVKDKGIGMSKSVQSKIFERFYRQTSGNIHNVKGFGLGLSYVKAVVEANRGRITVHSELGKGSQFDVFLPFTRES